MVCTITNTRREGSITVIKDLVPSTDDGTFDLLVDDTVVKAAAGDGDQGSKDVAPGTYSASENGAGGTALADYDSSVACEKNGQAYKDAAGTSIAGLEVDSNDTVVCTITNRASARSRSRSRPIRTRRTRTRRSSRSPARTRSQRTRTSTRSRSS